MVQAGKCLVWLMARLWAFVLGYVSRAWVWLQWELPGIYQRMPFRSSSKMRHRQNKSNNDPPQQVYFASLSEGFRSCVSPTSPSLLSTSGWRYFRFPAIKRKFFNLEMKCPGPKHIAFTVQLLLLGVAGNIVRLILGPKMKVHEMHHLIKQFTNCMLFHFY